MYATSALTGMIAANIAKIRADIDLIGIRSLIGIRLYHRPRRWHPLLAVMRAVLRRLEPFALDLWNTEIEEYLPEGAALGSVDKKTYFGGLYQKVVLNR